MHVELEMESIESRHGQETCPLGHAVLCFVVGWPPSGQRPPQSSQCDDFGGGSRSSDA